MTLGLEIWIAMETCWAIKQWDDVFEDYRSREVKRLRFLPFDLTRNSEAYRMLVSSRKGVEAYGVFWALVLVAARCPVRGVLADERGRSLSVARLAIKTGMSAEAIEDAIATLGNEDIGWLVRVQCPHPAGDAVSDVSVPTDETPSAHRPRTDGLDKNTDGPPMRTQKTPTPRAHAQNSNKNNNSNSNTGAAAAGDLDGINKARSEFLRRKPDWLPAGKPWLSQEACDELAPLPIGIEHVEAVYREAKASRLTLDNPAGYVRKKLRELGGVA